MTGIFKQIKHELPDSVHDPAFSCKKKEKDLNFEKKMLRPCFNFAPFNPISADVIFMPKQTYRTLKYFWTSTLQIKKI